MLKITSIVSFREAVGYLSDNEAFDRNLEQLKVRKICVFVALGR